MVKRLTLAPIAYKHLESFLREKTVRGEIYQVHFIELYGAYLYEIYEHSFKNQMTFDAFLDYVPEKSRKEGREWAFEKIITKTKFLGAVDYVLSQENVSIRRGKGRLFKLFGIGLKGDHQAPHLDLLEKIR